MANALAAAYCLLLSLSSTARFGTATRHGHQRLPAAPAAVGGVGGVGSIGSGCWKSGCGGMKCIGSGRPVEPLSLAAALAAAAGHGH